MSAMISDMSKYTYEQIAEHETGTVYVDAYYNGIRYIVLRGPGSLCAYVGVPADHPLAGFDYDSIPLKVHGGLTYASEGKGDYLPSGWYWYGWDYNHSGDYSFWYLKEPRFMREDEKKWTPKEVEEEAKWATYDLKSFCSLVERVLAKKYRLAVDPL